MSDDADAYFKTLARMETDIIHHDPSAYGTSIAISLKRIADSLEKLVDIKTRRPSA